MNTSEAGSEHGRTHPLDRRANAANRDDYFDVPRRGDDGGLHAVRPSASGGGCADCDVVCLCCNAGDMADSCVVRLASPLLRRRVVRRFGERHLVPLALYCDRRQLGVASSASRIPSPLKARVLQPWPARFDVPRRLTSATVSSSGPASLGKIFACPGPALIVTIFACQSPASLARNHTSPGATREAGHREQKSARVLKDISISSNLLFR